MFNAYSTRLCVVTDIEGYSRHTAPEQADAQQRLLTVIKFACRHAGISRVRARDRQDRGDGQMFLASPGIDESIAIPRLVLGLRHGLYLANRRQGGFGRIRLRAAMARGSISHGALGYPGPAPIEAGRLIDAQEFKTALKGAQSADFALAVTDELFKDVVKQDFPGLPSTGFTQISVVVKEYTGSPWIYLPDRGPVPSVGDQTTQWESVLLGAVAVGGAAVGWDGFLDIDGDDTWLDDPTAETEPGAYPEVDDDPGAETDWDSDIHDHDLDDDWTTDVTW